MECEERLQKIVEGFQKCRNAFTAIGDETRWKEISGLTNLIYESVSAISAKQ